jgi:hypothetical protein
VRRQRFSAKVAVSNIDFIEKIFATLLSRRSWRTGAAGGPFFRASIAVVLLVTDVPGLSLWLPALFK